MGCAKLSKEKPAGLFASLSAGSEPVSSPYNVHRKYIFERLVGRGHYGAVHLVTSRSNSKEMYAIKTISKTKVRSFRAMAAREASILHSLDHPNILKLIEIYEDHRYIYLVTEYCSGGNLLDYIRSNRSGLESQAALIMHKIFQGLNHLHIHKVCHRDLKPENCMFTANSELKIIDFGLSTRFYHKNGSAEMKSIVGTPSYQSPEVLQGKYGPKCDMWSAGVIMFTLLSAKLPFEMHSSKDKLERIRQGLEGIDEELGQGVSKQAKDLISRLLVLDSTQRLEPKEALEHPWFALNPSNKPVIDFEVLNTVKTCKIRSVFQQIALNLIIKSLQSDKITALTTTFLALDPGNTGFITSFSLKSGLNTFNLNYSSKSIDNVIKSASTQRDCKLSYSDFLSAAIDSHGLLSYERILTAFSSFDSEQKGRIYVQEVLAALERQGREIDTKLIKKLTKEFRNWPNGLCFDDFSKLIRP